MLVAKYENRLKALLTLFKEHEVLSPHLPSGSSDTCLVAEILGLAYARKDLNLTSSAKAIWIWRITDAGRQWLKERETY